MGRLPRQYVGPEHCGHLAGISQVTIRDTTVAPAPSMPTVIVAHMVVSSSRVTMKKKATAARTMPTTDATICKPMWTDVLIS